MNAITFWVKLGEIKKKRRGVVNAMAYWGKLKKKRRGVVNAMTFWVILGKIEK